MKKKGLRANTLTRINPGWKEKGNEKPDISKRKDGKLKTCDCVNGSTQRKYIGKNEMTIQTALTEGVLLTSTLEVR